MGEKVLDTLGLITSDLVQAKQRMHAINGYNIDFLGALFLRISGTNPSTGQRATTAAYMVYVTESTDLFYLSRRAINKLGIINAIILPLSAPLLPLEYYQRHWLMKMSKTLQKPHAKTGKKAMQMYSV